MLLDDFNVLDLTDGGSMICGKVLADLGADVIKVEPPIGSQSRHIGPFYKGERHPEKSLYWFAYNTNKRGITLDITSAEGRELFIKLAAGADIIVESFAPGYMEKMDLGYAKLHAINPRIIVVSITAFGQSGPKARYRGSDIIGWASSGYLSLCGSPNRPPNWISLPSQGYLHAGIQGAAGALIALYNSRRTGEGQQVDVSLQQCLTWLNMYADLYWDILQYNMKRMGPYSILGRARMRILYPCKDGHISIFIMGGSVAKFVQSSKDLVAWLDEESMAPGWLKDFDWIHGYDGNIVTQETVDRVEAPFATFFKTKTKAELFAGATARGILLLPANNTRDITQDKQLAARDFWIKVEHSALKDSLVYCGPFSKLRRTPMTIRKPAPLLGEDNSEIAQKGFSSLSKRDNVRPVEAKTNESALEGIKVLDFTWILAGPLTTKYLSDHGAMVVKVESHTRPDGTRLMSPFRDNVSALNRSSSFTSFNTNKYDISLDLNKPKGIEIAWKFIKWADVIVENFAPGAMKKWGLDYDNVQKVRPDIIYVSSSNQGQYGPNCKFGAYGWQLAALSGFWYVSGWPDGELCSPYGAYTDFICPPLNVTALLSALINKDHTGQGEYIEQSQFEGALQLMAPTIMDYRVNGTIASPNGNRIPEASPHGVYPCKGEDEWCTMAVFSDQEWAALCQVMGEPQWAMSPRLKTISGRKNNEDELDRAIAEWTSNYTKDEIEIMLQDAGIAAHGVLTCRDLYSDPQLLYRNHYLFLDHPEMGVHAHSSLPFILSKTPAHVERSGPCLGQHNEYVYKDILGLSDDEISDLYAEEVITTEAQLPF
jgi:crotonobetainyl-CoA:carnitine CoA-transferase CaiB-like acyl-CoA transferase